MTKKVTTTEINSKTKVITPSPYGWFYTKGLSVNHLHNLVHNTLAIIVPDADCYIEVKLTGSQFKKETTLLKEYAKACVKMNIKNIFATT